MKASEFINEDATVASDVATVNAPVGGVIRRTTAADADNGKYNIKRKKKNVSRRS